MPILILPILNSNIDVLSHTIRESTPLKGHLFFSSEEHREHGYQRWPCAVYAHGEDVNEEMVTLGHGRKYWQINNRRVLMKDSEVLRAAVQVLLGIVDQAQTMAKGGQNLSDVRIQIGVPGGAHADWCTWIDQITKINREHGFGYDSMLESASKFEIGNWSELSAKCQMILPVVRQMRNRLESGPKPRGYEKTI